ncbi:MAG TPA: hypothetical protein VF784_07505 [Anaerolineales bacterium]
MRTLQTMFLLPCLLLLSAGCGSIPTQPAATSAQATQPDIGRIVQATLQGMTALPTAAPTAMLTPAMPPTSGGSISGTLSYPADNLPPMYVTAYRVGTADYRYVITNAGQSTFQIDDLPPGAYHVIAYTVGGGGFPAGLAGGYTKAVPCGLATECADHSLIDIEVTAGQITTGIRPADWYVAAGTFPPFPQVSTALPTSAAGSTPSPSATSGSIAGELMYPASALPPLRVVAFQVGSGRYYYTETSQGQSSYELDNLPPGTYHVVAYVIQGVGFPAGGPGGYSQAVPCGLQATCNDHNLIDVVVTPGQVTTGVNPNDYYAPAGAFPPSPVP